MPDDTGLGVVALQQQHIVTQHQPLLAVKTVGADYANADRFGIKPTSMRTHFVQMAAGCNTTIGINHKVIADRMQRRVMPLPECLIARKPAMLVP